MNNSAINPDPAVLHFNRIEVSNNTIVVHASAIRTQAECPACGRISERRHSCYTRKIADLSWAGFPIRINVACHKFFCDQPCCERRIFVERLTNVADVYARRTQRLSHLISCLGLLAGGQASRRIAEALGLVISADTILRHARRFDREEQPTPRVLGINDWAFKKGTTYGTILVDLERRAVVDLLADRSAESLAQWLRQHPGVQIISRDRGGIYAEGAKQGAPDAIQVADRWHLLKNLFSALERMLQQHHADLRDAARQAIRETNSTTITQEAPATPTDKPCAMRPSSAATERRRARLEQVRQMQSEGMSLRQIARAAGLARHTVRKYSRWEELPTSMLERQSRRSRLDPWVGYLRERLKEDQHTAVQLHQELTGQGFHGSVDAVQRYVAKLRQIEEYPIVRARGPTAQAALGPSPRAATWLLLRSQDAVNVDSFESSFQDHLFEQCPLLREAVSLVKQFWTFMDERSSDKLDTWRANVTSQSTTLPHIAGFAQGLEQDIDAVRAAFSMEWSNGQTEGQINKLKMIKRRAYGRASFDLLRAWMLAEA